MVNVIHLSTNSGAGGAGKAALRISGCIGNEDYQSVVLSLYGREGDPEYMVLGSDIQRIIAGSLRVLHRVIFKLIYGDQYVYRSFSLYSHGFYRKVNSMKPDIVCIHWVQGEFFSIADLKRINCRKVLICHDQYYISAFAHHPIKSLLTQGWRSTLLGWLRERLEIWDMHRKKSLIKSVDCIVAPSRWLRQRALASSLNESTDVALIHLPIRVLNSTSSNTRSIGDNIDEKGRRPTVLIGGIGRKDDYYKGFDLMPEILEGLGDSDIEFKVILIGPAWFNDFASRFGANYVGEVRSDKTMSSLYSMSDIFLQPSRLETCSQMIIESIIHGTPVCAFDCYGAKELVRNKVSGLLVPPYDIESLVKACELVASENKRVPISEIKRIREMFSPTNVGREYRSLFQGLLTSSMM